MQINNVQAQNPAWLWANGGGGNGADNANSICSDTQGNVFVTGDFSGDSIVIGSNTLLNAGTPFADVNIFVAKYNSLGSVIWAKSAGGAGYNKSYAIAADNDGNVYITGTFAGPQIIFDSDTLTCGIDTNCIFIVKYNTLGNVIWARKSTETYLAYGFGITSDGDGHIFASGYFVGASMTLGGVTLSNGGFFNNMFVAKFDTAGNIIWARTCTGGTGPGSGDGFSVATDANGNVFMTGYFSATDITFGNVTLSNPNTEYSAYIVKYDSSGTVQWARKSSGGLFNFSYKVATDASGNAYMAGEFSNNSIVFGNDTLQFLGGNNDGFVVKYDAAGNVVWAKCFGGVSDDAVHDIVCDATGHIYITGNFYSSQISIGGILVNNTNGNLSDVYIAKLDGAGNVGWAIGEGGNSNDEGQHLALSGNNFLYASGLFNDTLDLGSSMLYSKGFRDFYIGKLDLTTGLTELQYPLNEMVIFPNPLTIGFTISGIKFQAGDEIIISDLTGREVYKVKTPNAASNVSIDAANLVNG
ncbi:MAG: hypothetical protein NTV09_13520, partial [Bacteroidetes bacterium]|nr:hypothetical protein [Bacteroidota bacterium]